jgi:hypothetical protein
MVVFAPQWKEPKFHFIQHQRYHQSWNAYNQHPYKHAFFFVVLFLFITPSLPNYLNVLIKTQILRNL